MSANVKTQHKSALHPIASGDGEDSLEIHVGDVIRSKFGLTTRTVVAVKDDTVVLVARTAPRKASQHPMRHATGIGWSEAVRPTE